MAEGNHFESERQEAASRFATAYKEHITEGPLSREEKYAEASELGLLTKNLVRD
jgi:hypothetical protein